MKIGVCGADCAPCNYLEKECGGCQACSGKVFWTAFVGGGKCPLYQCAENKGYNSCEKCKEMPCDLWRQTKDPNMTDKQHQQSIEERAQRLRSLAQ